MHLEGKLHAQLAGMLTTLKFPVACFHRLSSVVDGLLKWSGLGSGGSVHLMTPNDPHLAAQPGTSVDKLKGVAIFAQAVCARVGLGLDVEYRVSIPVEGDPFAAQVVSAAICDAGHRFPESEP
jgi:hypothetical protein